MTRIFIITMVVTLIELSGIAGDKFSITKHLKEACELNGENFTHVEITKIETEDVMVVKVDVPLSLSFSDIFVFFANGVKEILQLHLNEFLEGKFYAIPYQVKKEMKAKNLTKTMSNSFLNISGIFPISWLPKSCNKVSAAIIGLDGSVYNYYELKNFEISIPDLLVTEEYRNYSPFL